MVYRWHVSSTTVSDHFLIIASIHTTLMRQIVPQSKGSGSSHDKGSNKYSRPTIRITINSVVVRSNFALVIVQIIS